MREIQSPLIFWTASIAVVSYLLYITLRRRKGARPGVPDREPEL
jgi:hypothetical protein